MPDTRPCLLVAGDIGLDVLVRPRRPVAWGDDTPAHVDLVPGGQGANVATWARWARPDVDVHLLTHVGADAIGRLLARSLARQGVRVHAERAARTTRVTSLVEGQRRTLFADLGGGLWASPPEPLGGASVLYVSGYLLLRPGGAVWLARAVTWARRHGVRLAATPSARSLLARDSRSLARWRRLEGALWAVMANAAEARALTGASTARAAAAILGRRLPLALVTDGRRGAFLAVGGQAPCRIAAATVDRIVDPTGAGDAAAGAFLAGLVAGLDPGAAARGAMLGGAAAVAHQGAWAQGRSDGKPPAAT